MKRIISLIVLTTALLYSCGKERPRINLVIIGLDTARADHLGCYGYERRTSPAIDRLASEGTLFEYALSHSPWTLPSFATVFTSLYPTQHGAGFLRSTMGSGFPTLASILADHGYSTGAIINTAALSPAFEIDRGFAYYDVVQMSTRRIADGTTQDALAWIDAQGGDPFFLFVHYYDPHLPFSPPAPYDTLFDPDYAGALGNSFTAEFLATDRMNGFERMNALAERDKQHIVALYDGEIAFADRAVGDLIDGLEVRELRQHTLVVFLSDHGEEFFDHGGFAHGHTLYEELLRVPLVFSLRDGIPSGARVPGMVRLVDVMPTVLSLLGIDNDEHMEGRNLGGLFRGGAAAGPPAADALLSHEGFAEALLFGPEQKSVAAFPYKLIRHMSTGREALFNLDEDPGERVDLAGCGHGASPLAVTPDERRELRQLLYGTINRASDTWYVQIDCGGAGHMLDITITAGGATPAAEITLLKAFGPGGRLLEDGQVGICRETESCFRLTGRSLDGALRLAFKSEPPRAPVEFDFMVNGEPAAGMTHVGGAASSPGKMPFTARGGHAGRKALGKPETHPGPPYFLVWHSGQDYQRERPLRLGKDIQQELRSLGYVQ
jgi:arylsulfatase A-like enzyme